TLATASALLVGANKKDAGRLKDVVSKLTDAVDPSRWVDGNHLVPKPHGSEEFDREQQAAAKLEEMTRDPATAIPNATLQPLIDALVQADQILATTAIADATAAGGNAGKLGDAAQELTKAAS